MSSVVGCITVFKRKVYALLDKLREIPGTEEVVKEIESWL